MRCRRCVERGRPYNFMSNPRCAFEHGVFDKDNWMCATVNEIRDLLDENNREMTTFRERRDDETAMALFHESVGWIHAGWYKDRGTVEFMSDNHGEPLTLEAAEKLLDAVARRKMELPRF